MGLVQGLGWLLAVVRLRGPLRAPMRDLQGFYSGLVFTKLLTQR